MGESIEQLFKPGNVVSERYRITGKIAEGGMGIVYEASHLKLSGLRVAIKVLRDGRLENEESLGRFRREAEICARLQHPHIVSIIDWDVLPNGIPFFVMEYLKGETLATRMRRTRIPFGHAYEIIKQTGLALKYAHQQGVVHRDLKPSNIFLVAASVSEEYIFTKIVDFGISKDLFSHTLKLTQSTVIGTPGYMSPEQAKGQTDAVGPKSDQFALATIAYEIIGNRPAFCTDTVESTLFKIVYESPPPVEEIAPGIEPQVAAAIRRGMAKNPEDRFPDMDAFLESFFPKGFEKTISPASLATKTLERVEKPRRKRNFYLLIVVCVMGFLSIPTAIFLYNRSTGENSSSKEMITLPKEEKKPAVQPGEGSTPLSEASAEPKSSTSELPPEKTPQLEPKIKSGIVKKEEAIPKDALEKIAEAEEMIASAHYQEALFLLKQSLIIYPTPKAWRLIVISYCGLKDLGNAKAFLQKIPVQDRGAIIRECKKLGLVL